jgi:hypothetical protein
VRERERECFYAMSLAMLSDKELWQNDTKLAILQFQEKVSVIGPAEIL